MFFFFFTLEKASHCVLSIRNSEHVQIEDGRRGRRHRELLLDVQLVQQLGRGGRLRAAPAASLRRRQDFLRAERRGGMRAETHPGLRLVVESGSAGHRKVRHILMTPSGCCASTFCTCFIVVVVITHQGGENEEETNAGNRVPTQVTDVTDVRCVYLSERLRHRSTFRTRACVKRVSYLSPVVAARTTCARTKYSFYSCK